MQKFIMFGSQVRFAYTALSEEMSEKKVLRRVRVKVSLVLVEGYFLKECVYIFYLDRLV